MKTIRLRSQKRNIGFFGKSCRRNMIRIRLENGRTAWNSERGRSPLRQSSRSNARKDTSRHDKRETRFTWANRANRPIYLSEQSRDIPFRGVDPSDDPSAPEEWPDSALLGASNNIEREGESECVCVCVCVCQTYYYCWVSLLPLLVIDGQNNTAVVVICDGDTIALYIIALV